MHFFVAKLLSIAVMTYSCVYHRKGRSFVEYRLPIYFVVELCFVVKTTSRCV